MSCSKIFIPRFLKKSVSRERQKLKAKMKDFTPFSSSFCPENTNLFKSNGAQKIRLVCFGTDFLQKYIGSL